jgi:hypothetical protein
MWYGNYCYYFHFDEHLHHYSCDSNIVVGFGQGNGGCAADLRGERSGVCGRNDRQWVCGDGIA